MAAMATSQRLPSLSNGSAHRKPIAVHELSPEHHDWDADGNPLPSDPLGGGPPRLRQPPVSPVRVEFQPEHWAQPSNANIETDDHQSNTSHVHPYLADRPLPKTPEAPTPPPHTPVMEQTIQQAVHRGSDKARAAARRGSNKALPTPELGRLDYSQRDSLVSPEPEDASVSDDSKTQGANRRSRDTDASASTCQQQASTESSATTSSSSVSGINETPENQDDNVSPESSIIEDPNQPVPQLQYHHQAFLPRASSTTGLQDARTQSNPDLTENPASINRHLTPSSHYGNRVSLPRPQSAYSVYSDIGPRGRSPGFYAGGSHIRAPSAQSRRSPDTRPSSYAELLNVPYPQAAPAPITLDNSQLRNVIGTNASLLSTQKTLEMYRQNVKKTNDFSIQYSFAVFLISTAQDQGLNFDDYKKKSSKDRQSPHPVNIGSSPLDLVREARSILQKLSSNGYPFAQYYLADGYASGLFSKGKEDYNAAFPLFVLAAKHGHAESAYRAALCYEFGWGCRKDPTKAVLYLRTAASKRHPGAMTRLGKACLSGDLGEKRYREGIKWLKLAAESADTIYNAAPHHLGCLYETGYGDDIFQDESYAAELFTQAADLGHAEANYRMGDAYEHGRLNCPRDPALSVHFYTGAAERGHAGAMMGLCAWYMVGAEPLLEKDEEEAYEWARRSAELGKFGHELCLACNIF